MFERSKAPQALVACVLVCIIGVGVATSARAEAQAGGATKSTFDGVYTDPQSARGATISAASCAVCHGQKLEGTDMGPGVQGPDFRMNWSGRSLADLFDKIKTTMPANDPGSLGPAATADLVAYILKLNEYPTGAAELPTEAEVLNQIRLRHEK